MQTMQIGYCIWPRGPPKTKALISQGHRLYFGGGRRADRVPTYRGKGSSPFTSTTVAKSVTVNAASWLPCFVEVDSSKGFCTSDTT